MMHGFGANMGHEGMQHSQGTSTRLCRFTLDRRGFICATRFFQKYPYWVGIPRGPYADTLPEHVAYEAKFGPTDTPKALAEFDAGPRKHHLLHSPQPAPQPFALMT